MIPAATPEFVSQMEAVLDVDARPYDATHPVVCLDESPRQIVRESRRGLTDRRGVEHYDYEYHREGVADLCMIAEPLAGRRQVLVREDHSRLSYGRALLYIGEELYAEARRITLVEDNHSAHKLSALYELVSPQRARAIIERLEVSALSRQALPRRLASRQECHQRVQQWVAERNHRAVAIDWQFTTADARIKLKRLYPAIDP